MKQKLLLVSAAMMLMASSAFADGWVKPVVPTPDPVEPSFDGVSVFMLYNPEVQGYLVAGNDWGTRACVALKDSVPAGYVFQFPLVSEGVVEMLDSCVVKGAGKWMNMFNDGAYNNTYMDMGNQNPVEKKYWAFTKIEGENAYHIENVNFKNLHNDSVFYLGCATSMERGSTGAISLDLISKDSVAYTKWYFVEPRAIQAAELVLKAQLATYKLAMQLDADIKAALAKYPSLDVADEQAVFNNTGSTDEDLKAAIESVDTKVKTQDAIEAQNTASATNPANLTSMIENASFDVQEDFHGWSGSGWEAGGTRSTCAERYGGKSIFDTWQEIKNLPNGVYALSASGFYRVGSHENSYSVFKSGDPVQKNLKLYAVNITAEGNDTSTVAMPNIYYGIQPNTPIVNSNQEVSVVDGGNTYYVPNTMAAAVAYFEAGYLNNTTVMFEVTEGTIKIGAYKRSTYADNDWCIFDNFALTYYGKAESSYQYWLDAYIATLPVYGEDVYVTASVINAFNEVLAANKTATDAATVKAKIAIIEEAQEAVDANVAAWQAFQNAIAEARKTTGDGDVECPEKDELSDFVDLEVDDLLEAKELTTEELIEKTKWLEDLRNAVIQNGLRPGTSFTSYLTNPAFANGDAGWQGRPTVNSSCGEKYGSGAFDVYQEVKGAPVGVYEISMQGFYRQYRDDDAAVTAWYNVFTPEGDYKEVRPDTLGYVYMNDNKTAMNCVYDFQTPVGELYSGGTTTDPLGFYQYPNTMASAAEAFAQGAYKVSAFGLVAKSGDVLRLGVKGHLGNTGNCWVIFDNFELTYQGYKAEIIEPELNKAVLGLSNVGLVGADVKAEITALLADAESVDKTDGKAMFNILADAFALNTKVETSAALFVSLKNKLAEFNQAISQSMAVEATKTEASALYDKVFAEYTTYTDAQATEAIAALDEMITKLAMPDTTDASDERPVPMTSVIKTPSFTDEANNASTAGWSGTDGCGTNFSGLEFYNTDFNIYQDIAGLPAGTYSVGVQAFTRDGSTVADSAAYANGEIGIGKLYAEANETHKEVALPHCVSVENNYLNEAPGFGTEYSWTKIEGEETLTYFYPNNMQSVQGFFEDGKYTNELFITINEGETLRIGIKCEDHKSEQWIMMDNFTLTFFGPNSNKDVTDIETVATALQVVKVERYDLNGQRVNGVQSGMTIVRTTYSNGNVVVSKVFNK